MTSYCGAAPPHEAAAVVHVNRHLRVGVDAARVLAEAIEHHVARDDRIDLDAVDVTRAEDERRQQVAPAARADDERREAARAAPPGGTRAP